MKYDFICLTPDLRIVFAATPAGKERDNETGYDYFGARYYDSRIANWTSVDPLFEKHYSYSPYNYVLRSPLILVDPDGMQTNLHTYQLSDENLSTSSDYRAIGESYDDEAVRKGRKNPFMPQPGILEAEVIDPVDLLTGMALAKLSFKLAEKFVFKEGAKIVSESVTKGVVKETTEEFVKYAFPKLVPQLEKQLTEQGANKIFKSLRSHERILKEHIEKLPKMELKSAVEDQIIKHQKTIETIKAFIKEKGL